VLGTPPKSWTEGHKLAQQMHMQFPSYTAVPLNELIKNASPEAIDLMSMMMQYDGFKRPSAQQVLNHPYFTKSIISKDASIWGAKSLREKDLGSLGSNSLYKPAKSNVFNIQGKNKIDPYRNDIDLEFDNDINEIMNKDFNKS
jgi:serine/threonine protein kinase